MTLQELKTRIEDLTGIEDISLRTRRRDYIVSRCIFYDVAYRYTTLTYDKIGSFVGMDHSTAIYGINTLEIHLKHEPRFKKVYDQLIIEFRDEEVSEFFDKVQNWIGSIPVRKHEEILKKLKRIEL